MGTVAANSVVCPRCGYDLRGQVDTWRVPLATQADVVRFESGEVLESEVGAKCPVEGTCSECGLGFEWKYVFRPELAGPAWFVETRRVGRVRAFVGTVVRVIFQSPFFRNDRGVKLETPQNVRRRWWFLAHVFITLPTTCIALQIVTDFLRLSLLGGMPVQLALSESINNVIADRSPSLLQLPFFGGRQLLLFGISASLGFVLMLASLPYTRAKAKVQFAHVWRACAYSLAWLVLPLALSITLTLIEVCLDAISAAKPNSRIIGVFAIRSYEALRALDDSMENGGRSFFVLLIVCWSFVFWWKVLRRWWRMEEAFVAYAACAVPVMLLLITILAYLVAYSFT